MNLSTAILILSYWERNWETIPDSHLVQLARLTVKLYARQPGGGVNLQAIIYQDYIQAA